MELGKSSILFLIFWDPISNMLFVEHSQGQKLSTRTMGNRINILSFIQSCSAYFQFPDTICIMPIFLWPKINSFSFFLLFFQFSPYCQRCLTPKKKLPRHQKTKGQRILGKGLLYFKCECGGRVGIEFRLIYMTSNHMHALTNKVLYIFSCCIFILHLLRIFINEILIPYYCISID